MKEVRKVIEDALVECGVCDTEKAKIGADMVLKRLDDEDFINESSLNRVGTGDLSLCGGNCQSDF